MSEMENKAAEAGQAGQSGDALGNRSFVLSVVALVVGVAALGLASIPAVAYDRPLPNPFTKSEKEERRIEPPAEREGGITLRYKNLSVNVGGKTVEKQAVPVPEPKSEITSDPIRWFTISAIGCALVGLVIACVGHLRERHTILTVGSMSCCAAAITWQYLAIGIAVGAAAAVFLIVFSIFASAVGSVT